MDENTGVQQDTASANVAPVEDKQSKKKKWIKHIPFFILEFLVLVIDRLWLHLNLYHQGDYCLRNQPLS